MSLLAGCVAVSLLAWLWLLLAHGFYWRTDVRLPAGVSPDRWPSVAVVVPARDEAGVLPHSLPTLLAQDYPGPAEILLVDDGSTDGTGELARALADRHLGLPLSVTSPGEPAPGWTGKLWALRHGMALAGQRARRRAEHTGDRPAAGGGDPAGNVTRAGVAVTGPAGKVPEAAPAGGPLDPPAPAEPPSPGAVPARSATAPSTTRSAAPEQPPRPAPPAGGRPVGTVDFLLLTDADIAHAPDSLRELVRAAHGGGLDVVSQMARLRAVTGWERLIVPAFVYFFAQLYPFRRINRAGGRTAAAAGGCVLLRAEAAARADIPGAIRRALIDDVALARAVRRSGGRIWLGLADRVESVRPYPRLAPLWRMVSRSAYAQLRHSPPLLAVTVLGLALLYPLPPVALLVAAATRDGWTALAAGAAWAVMTATYLPILRYYRQPLWLAPALPVTATLYLLMTLDSAVAHHRGRPTAWKGRRYPAG